MAAKKDPETEKRLRQALLDKMRSGEDATAERQALLNYNKAAAAKAPSAAATAEQETGAGDGVPAKETDVLTSYRTMLEQAASAGKSKGTDEIASYLSSLQSRYDSLLDTLKSGNYRDYEMYDRIVSDYDRMGASAAMSAHADAAADNAGNISSLGAANAHRQRLAYRAAGEAAARDAYNDYIDGLVSGVKAYGSDMKDALSLLSQSSDRDSDRDTAILSAYDKYAETARKAGRLDPTGVGEGATLSEKELSALNLGERNDAYMRMLMTLYPEYAEEIEAFFHPI